MGWLLLLALAAADPAMAPNQADSTNFVIRTQSREHDAREISHTAEQWRLRLQTFWCGAEQPQWEPRCDVIVHASKASYLAAVGRGAEQTAGSSWIEFAGKQPSKRRIDLLGTGPNPLAAFPHELTHVIFADLFAGRQPPRWADEGAAMLADSLDKLRLHQRDLESALERGLGFEMGELLLLDRYPAAHRVPGFYGQSASVSAFLARRDDPARFVQFVQHALDHGYDEALRDVYRIAGVRELEREWRAHGRGARGFHGLQLTLNESPPRLLE